jgi:hypothetical protein
MPEEGAVERWIFTAVREGWPLITAAVFIGLLALKEKLRPWFLSRDDASRLYLTREQLNEEYVRRSEGNATIRRIEAGLQGTEKRNEVQEISMGALEADLVAVRDRLLKLEEHDRHQLQRVNERIIAPLETVVERMEQLGRQNERTTALIEGIVARLERLEKRMDRAERNGR